ncbi:MAG: hypothetical protein A2700_00205 [Candidatus Blackburnbacteria bacterium RIFCSPHIGHO2_01_FULL_44_64]|nr:MAG: hypothetical protein A2700_00205 [Candidatus Blackburnbacteria bacterium RIFCSPHIGHO2_01_FULL_44_64]OGY14116.1 MAG: hypothetical protein A3A62_02015 [Candidatus Blackburnbacteria bacterium RIFCSPLOWO2_01_FULL_44_43]
MPGVFVLECKAFVADTRILGPVHEADIALASRAKSLGFRLLVLVLPRLLFEVHAVVADETAIPFFPVNWANGLIAAWAREPEEPEQRAGYWMI